MSIKKPGQTRASDTQVEEIIEAAAIDELDQELIKPDSINDNQDDVFGDIPIVDNLYTQDEYWTGAIDLKVSGENEVSQDALWNIDVKEGDLLEQGLELNPIELDSSEFEYDDEIHATLKYADQFEW